MNHDYAYARESGVSRDAADSQFKKELMDAANGNAAGEILATVYYEAVSALGSLFHEGDLAYPRLTEPERLERQEQIEISIIEQTALEFVEYFGAGTSSDAWYDGSDFGDYVCDDYYQGGGGGGRGGNDDPIWLPERQGPAALAC